MELEESGGTGERPDPERSSAEIRQLLRKLDPQTGGGHKDRVRRLARFRNYVETDPRSGFTPEFYDDDFPLLLLGSHAPAAILDEELVGQKFYGLLQACGTPSADHNHMLKRSARPAMSLLKYLVLDWREHVNGRRVELPNDTLNPFAFALCNCTLSQLQLMNLEMHIEGDKRGGAMGDACRVIVLVCSNHLAEDGESKSLLLLDNVLPSASARERFNQWLSSNGTAEEKLNMESVENLARKRASAARQNDVMSGEQSEGDEDNDSDSDGFGDEVNDEFDGDVLTAFKRRKKLGKNVIGKKEKGKKKNKAKGPAVRWEQSDVYKMLQARAALDKCGPDPKQLTVRDREEAMAERARIEMEKAKALQKDPLAIRTDKELDLGKIQSQKMDMLVQSLKDLDEDLNEVEQEREKNLSTDKNTQEEYALRIRFLEAQKESLEGVLDSITAIGAEETKITDLSILPTDPHFDPILFLTLVHRNCPYGALNKSMERLASKTDNQVQQLQNLVRDNFALFVRCADGIDVFNTREGEGVEERMDSIEGLALVCSDQARKSFKPLLDNTNEVRKVQSALSVLKRVVPIIQAPHLMRQHLENNRFSQALQAYRLVLVIDDNCNIDLLNQVKLKAADAAREARRDLEKRLSQDKVSLPVLLDGIRDLSELLELNVPEGKGGEGKVGIFEIGSQVIHPREHTPGLACLLLQAAHFKLLVKKTIELAEQNARRIYDGESLSQIQGATGGDATQGNTIDTASITQSDTTVSDKGSTSGSKKTKHSSGNQWKYDVLDARVFATIRAVDVIRNWLPRLLNIGTAACEDERRRAARAGSRGRKVENDDDGQLSAFQVFLSNISPDVAKMVEHATFCALGSSSRGMGKDVKMSFGRKAPEKLRTLLKSPLPPTQSSKCAKELADLVLVVGDSSVATNALRPSEKENFYETYSLSPLEECKQMAEEAVVTVERRRCIFAFDVCARTCANRASGSGRFDGEALLTCLRTLSEELTRSEECASEVEKGCELVVRRCCEGLASYVRDRGDSARLRAVAECADALNGSLHDVVREVEYMGCHSNEVEEVMEEDVMGLESAMFDEYLENVRDNVAGCCRVGWLDMDSIGETEPDARDISAPATFPAYLSASLLAIVRCRAQVERALGNKVRRSENTSYQFVAMATAADGVVEGICNEIKDRKTKMKVRQADRMANELQFLINTLKTYLSEETLSMVENSRRTLCSRAGRGAVQGDGPDGLAALEELERLGRVYVLCLGE
mmetsp:Transcript_23760/g.35081  ORF Transcript_23760/g.35081 Transcript_23760/m.35081 type:complete len:1255 (-) Transcript_23760:54-3818(-)